MGIKIIDNKKVEMTETEISMYQDICRSYDRPNFKGEDLFKDLFETDELGRIVYLKPPSTRHPRMEVFLFVGILMQHQHIRSMHFQVSNMCKQMQEKMNELDALMSSVKKEKEAE